MHRSELGFRDQLEASLHYATCMGRVADRSKLAPEEYLAWERTQERKHEYFDGEVFAMAGGSPRHNRLIMTVGIALDSPLTACGCVVNVDTIFDAVFAFPGD